MDNNFKPLFPKALDLDQLIFKIGEVSKILNVSARQLRYWEQRGYIRSIRNSSYSSRVFDMKNFMCANLIKYYLDEGFTLSVAHESAKKNLDNMKFIRKFMTHSFHGIENINNHPAVNLGYFDKEKKTLLYGFIDEENNISYKVFKND